MGLCVCVCVCIFTVQRHHQAKERRRHKEKGPVQGTNGMDEWRSVSENVSKYRTLLEMLQETY